MRDLAQEVSIYVLGRLRISKVRDQTIIFNPLYSSLDPTIGLVLSYQTKRNKVVAQGVGIFVTDAMQSDCLHRSA